MLNIMVRKKLQTKTASEAFTTASVVARPTPTAPSRVVNPFWQTHDNIAAARPANHVRHVVSAVNVEHENRNEITGCDAHGDALRHQKWHRDHHGQYTRHYQVINRIHGKRAQGIDLLGDFHRADFG